MAENERGEMLARKNQAKRGASPRALKRKAALERGQEALATWLDLPTDVMLDWPRVSLLGKRQLYIENHKGILSFSDKAVTVRAADSTIKISGSRLEIKEFTKDLIIIAGHLKGVIYEY